MLVLIVVGVLISILSRNPDSGAAAPNPEGNSATPPVAAQAEKPIDLNDAEALDNKYGVAAGVYCASDADDYLRSVAKYDFKWDEVGFLEQKFDKFLAHVQSPGVLTAVSHKAKLQNGFGAYQHVELLCDYDTQAQKVLRYRLVNSSP